MEQKILEQNILEIAHQDMAALSTQDQSAFAMVRRSGLGASDSSIYMGVNQWKTVDELIIEKRSIGITPEEIEVSNKEVVRKGRDLEPIILRKFEETFHVDVAKPTPMYRIKEHPQLTINFDGVADVSQLVPIEAKFVSIYANKYWDRSKALDILWSGSTYTVGEGDIVAHINMASKLYGIPPYYYTQIQQQMLGLNADFGFFAVLFDKGWEFKAFYIGRDKRVQDAIIEESARVWGRIKGEH